MANAAEYKVGTILHSSWGYDMVIVDFYKVVRNTGKTLTLERMGKSYVTGGGMRGECVPAPGKGETINRRINKHGWVKGYYDSEYLSKWDGTPCFYDHMD